MEIGVDPGAATVDALERQLSFTRALLSAIPNPVFFKDAEGRYLGCNRAFEEVMGVTSDAMRGKTVFELWPSHEAHVYHQKDLALLAAPARQVYEFEVTDKDGRVRPVIYGKDVFFDQQGRPAGIVGTFLDISERKEAEAALADALAILNRTPAVVFRWRAAPGWPVEFVSENVVQLFGRPAGAFLAGEVSYLDTIHPDDRARVSDEVAEHSGAGDRESFAHLPYRVVRPDGGVRWVDDRTTIRRAADGAPVCYEGIVTDVTAQVEAEQALRRSEARYRVVSELSSDFAYALDVAPDGALTPAWATDGLERVTGYTRAELPGPRAIAQVVHPDDRPLLEERTSDLLRGITRRIAYRLVTKGGELRWVSDLAQPVLEARGGRVIRIVGAVQDITERRRAEEERLRLERQVQQAQKLESLGVLAGGIAHDFNNILMAILGNTELALSCLPDDAPARGHLKEIGQAARRAAELARQMLAYSGRATFVTERVSLNALVKEMSELLAVAVAKNVRLELELADPSPTLLGDSTQLRQVVLNLLTNASEALGERPGTVRLTTGVRHCDRALLAAAHAAPELPEGSYAFVEVSDDGAGIAAEDLPRLFDPFFTTKFAGRGLGLAVVQGIVRGHRGLIDVESLPGGGSTFCVYLPLGEPPPAERSETPAPAPAPGAWRGRGTVLVADDEQAVRLVAAQMLQRLGFAVLVAADGDAALETFRTHHAAVDCVLLDLTMPGLDSRAVVDGMRALVPEVKVVLASGYAEQDATTGFAGVTLSGFLAKPFDAAQLEAVMRVAMP